MNNEQIEKIWKAFWALPETKRNSVAMMTLGVTFGWMKEEMKRHPVNNHQVKLWFDLLNAEVCHD